MTDPQQPPYDSRPATLAHSLRVGALMVQVIAELSERSVQHDLSKTLPPEVDTFDKFTPLLRDVVYGSDEYKRFLVEMAPALDHHYAHNAHHPESKPNGINGMTLADLIEMLADWKAATERHANGDLRRSIEINADRFGIDDQLKQILIITAEHHGWIPVEHMIPAGATDAPAVPAWTAGA